MSDPIYKNIQKQRIFVSEDSARTASKILEVTKICMKNTMCNIILIKQK